MTTISDPRDTARRDEANRVDAVVVAYKSASTILSCIESICADEDVRTVVVIDNSSDALTRRIVENVALVDSRVHYLDPGRNMGFAAACNIGAEYGSGVRWLAFVNPDVVLKRGISELVRATDGSTFSIVSGGLTGPDGSINNARHRAGLTGELRKAFTGSRHYIVSSLPDAERLAPVDQVDGAFMIMSADVFGRLGGFDEGFELYYEDVDICIRAHDLGPVLIASREWGVHAAGSSYRQSSERAFVALRVSRIRYLRKLHGSSPALSCVLVFMAAGELITRSLFRTGDGARTRLRALVAQVREVRNPGSVRVLVAD